jgi:tetratricopeptide (TPR) repeat protein
MDCFSRVLDANPHHHDARMARARANYQEGRFEDAQIDFRRADPDGNDGACLAALACCFAHLRNYGPAEKVCRRAIDLGFQNAAVYSNLGFNLRKLARFDEAEEHLSKAIGLDPQLGIAYFNRGFARLLRSAQVAPMPLAEARSDIEQAVRLKAVSEKMLREAADLASPMGKADAIASGIASYCLAEADRLAAQAPAGPPLSWIADPLPPL